MSDETGHEETAPKLTRAEMGRLLRSARAHNARTVEQIAHRGGLTFPAVLHLERGTARSEIAATQYVDGLEVPAVVGGPLRAAIRRTEWFEP